MDESTEITVQINLQDSKGNTFDIDHINISQIDNEISARNAYLIVKESNYRWRINGETEEFDDRDKIEGVTKYVKALLDICQSKGLQCMVIVPTTHQFGEKWEYLIANVEYEGKESSLFNNIRFGLNQEKNTNEQKG